MGFKILCSIISIFCALYYYSKAKRTMQQKIKEAVITGLITYCITSVIIPPLTSVYDIALYINANIPKIEKRISNIIYNLPIGQNDNQEHDKFIKTNILSIEEPLDQFPFNEYIRSLWATTEETKVNENQEKFVSPTPIPTPFQESHKTLDTIHSTYIRITENVKVRIRPNDTSRKVGTLYSGYMSSSLCETMGEDGKMWHKISNEDMCGYIPSKYVEILDFDKKKYVMLKPGTITLNVRKKPNTQCTIITQIPEDVVCTVLGQKKENDNIIWYKIKIDDGTKGYIAAEFVNVLKG